MEILCLMGLFPDEYEAEVAKNSISGMQNAANKLQWAILDGLIQQAQVNIQVINSMFLGSYPKRYKKARIPSFYFNVGGTLCGYNVGFWNLPIIKIASRYIRVKKKIKEWVTINNGKEKVVIAYAMTSPIVELLRYIKLRYPSIKCILVVPDLPEYMNMSKKSKIFKAIKKSHIAHMRKCLRDIDGYVLLTEYMKDWFNRPIQYTVVEGIFKGSSTSPNVTLPKEKVVLYSGGIQKEYGVLDLVESFQKTEITDWKLELIGDGELTSMLHTVAQKDKRITLKGLLPNSQVVERQKQVSVLINPRKGNQLFTKYSFPSKTIEYMSSGTPMAGYRLPGIPDEYYKYMYEIPDEENGLCECLKEIMQISELQRIEKGLQAQKFIQNEKNAKVQCSKIMQLIYQLIN